MHLIDNWLATEECTTARVSDGRGTFGDKQRDTATPAAACPAPNPSAQAASRSEAVPEADVAKER